MLISPQTLERYWSIHPAVLIHIGAHEAEELDDYESLGWGSRRTLWVEALPAKARLVQERILNRNNHQILTMVAWDKSGEYVEFNETNNGQSSSALQLGEHATIYPDIQVTNVVRRRTSAIADEVDLENLGRIGLINLDVQGAELRALKGFGPHLSQVDAIYCEVNTRELYEGCALLADLDVWLENKGFSRVDWVILPEGWGDALWIRQSLVPKFPQMRRARRRLVEERHRLRLRERARRLLDQVQKTARRLGK